MNGDSRDNPITHKDVEVPEGFEPVLVRQDGGPGVPVAGRIRHVGTRLIFWIGDGDVPKSPLKAYGEFMHKGWGIPTRWAIDADGVCWMDNAHGHPLQRVRALGLLRSCEDPAVRNHIRKHLGMEPEEPEWAQQARASGWIPPIGVPDVILKRVAEVEAEPEYGRECENKIGAILATRGASFGTRLNELESQVRLLRSKLRSKMSEVERLKKSVEELRAELNNARR